MPPHKRRRSSPSPKEDKRTKTGQADVEASMKSPLENDEAIVRKIEELEKRIDELEERFSLNEKFKKQRSSENLIKEVKIVMDTEIFLEELPLLEQLRSIQIGGLNIILCMPFVVFSDLERLKKDKNNRKVSKMARKAMSFIRQNIKEPTFYGQSAAVADSCKTMIPDISGKSDNDRIIEFGFHLSVVDSSNVFIMSNNKSTINKTFFWLVNSLDVETLKQAIKGKTELSWQEFVTNQPLIVHPRR